MRIGKQMGAAQTPRLLPSCLSFGGRRPCFASICNDSGSGSNSLASLLPVSMARSRAGQEGLDGTHPFDGGRNKVDAGTPVPTLADTSLKHSGNSVVWGLNGAPGAERTTRWAVAIG